MIHYIIKIKLKTNIYLHIYKSVLTARTFTHEWGKRIGRSTHPLSLYIFPSLVRLIVSDDCLRIMAQTHNSDYNACSSNNAMTSRDGRCTWMCLPYIYICIYAYVYVYVYINAHTFLSLSLSFFLASLRSSYSSIPRSYTSLELFTFTLFFFFPFISFVYMDLCMCIYVYASICTINWAIIESSYPFCGLLS